MPIEYNLLCLLAKNVGKVLTYQFILDKIWKNALESDLSSLRVYMTTLRKRLINSMRMIKNIFKRI